MEAAGTTSTRTAARPLTWQQQGNTRTATRPSVPRPGPGLVGALPCRRPAPWDGCRLGRQQHPARCHALRYENKELLVGDVVVLISFALWKQLAAIIAQPDFPGLLAPLHLDTGHFVDFLSFSMTLCGVWVAASALVGGYRSSATEDLPTTLRTTSQAWLTSMPVAAAQLVLSTALCNRVLVGEPGFAQSLPLPASGPGEPFATAVGVLGLMVGWRAFYALYLDWWNGSSEQDMARFNEAVLVVAVQSGMAMVVLQVLTTLGSMQAEVHDLIF